MVSGLGRIAVCLPSLAPNNFSRFDRPGSHTSYSRHRAREINQKCSCSIMWENNDVAAVSCESRNRVRQNHVFESGVQGSCENVERRLMIEGFMQTMVLCMMGTETAVAEEEKSTATAKPGIIEKLLERSRTNKARYDKERLDDYYRRNYKDYFDFVKGSIRDKKPENLTEAEKGILRWLEKNR